MTIQISLLLEASTWTDLPFAVCPDDYRPFADELGRQTGLPVPVAEAHLRDAPGDGFVLFAPTRDLSLSLAECGEAQRESLPSRLVLLDVSQQRVLEQLEQHRLAGAVDSLTLSEWKANPTGSHGPFGLRSIAEEVGAKCSPLPWLQSDHYCMLIDERRRGLPQLLADYLVALNRDRMPLAEIPSIALIRFAKPIPEETQRPPKGPRAESQRPAALARPECVSTKRAVASLKRVRECSGKTLAEIAEARGIDFASLRLLEEGDWEHLTLGMLRGYALALAPHGGWTLANVGVPLAAAARVTYDQPRPTDWQAEASLYPVVVSGGFTVQRYFSGGRPPYESVYGSYGGSMQEDVVDAGV